MVRSNSVIVATALIPTEIQYFEVDPDLANNMLFHITGFLMVQGTTTPIVGRPIYLYIDDVKDGGAATLPQPPGVFDFDCTFTVAGTHTIQAKFLGDATYAACESTKVTVTAGTLQPTAIVYFNAVKDASNRYRYYITGNLKIIGTQFGLNNEAVHLFVDDVEVNSELTHTGAGEGYFDFDYTFTTTGEHAVQVKYFGSVQFAASQSSRTLVSVVKDATIITIVVNPTSGTIPLNVTVTGKLTAVITGAGLFNKQIDLLVNSVKVGQTTTDSNGDYSIAFTISEMGSYTVETEFLGDTDYLGC